MTENLTTDLSRIRGSFVIARNTAFTFKGKAVDARQISKELGVRYVLEGSVQRDQNRVRVNAQLIDGETGAHLWADRFQEDVADLFKLQDDVVARLANALSYELVRAEAEAASPLEKSRCHRPPHARQGGAHPMDARAADEGRLVPCEPCSSERSRSTPKDADALVGSATPMRSNTRLDGPIPKPTTTQKYSVRPTDPSRSLVTTLGHIA